MRSNGGDDNARTGTGTSESEAKFLAALAIQRAQKRTPWGLPVSNRVIEFERTAVISNREDPPASLQFPVLPLGMVEYDRLLEGTLQRYACGGYTGPVLTGHELGMWSRSPSVCSLGATHRVRLDPSRARPEATVGLLVIEGLGLSTIRVQASAFSRLRSQDTHAIRWLVPAHHSRGHWYSRARTNFATYVGALKAAVGSSMARKVDVLAVLIDGISDPVVPDPKELAFAERLWMTGNVVPVVTSSDALLICPAAPDHRTFLEGLQDSAMGESTMFRNVRYLIHTLPSCRADTWTRLTFR